MSSGGGEGISISGVVAEDGAISNIHVSGHLPTGRIVDIEQNGILLRAVVRGKASPRPQWGQPGRKRRRSERMKARANAGWKVLVSV